MMTRTLIMATGLFSNQSQSAWVLYLVESNPNHFSVDLDQVDLNPVQIQFKCVRTGELTVQIQSVPAR